ncbi:F-box domain, cyclin-like protein [Artemisia annua]|uniref:F-box protein GID2 n=1 Tax=Artemisia annua TaxID=35608 RepID=A0A2U1KVA8_ARTAN|nr:F-box domain, cyclin-like protein [Artemisia annua]
MKRSIPFSSDLIKMKKKIREEDLVPEELENMSEVLSDDNLLYEILKHVDASTLASAGCVNHQWNRTAQDERLWELICTRHWANIGCPHTQLRSVVLALGGFKRLHSQYLWPLSKPTGPTSSSSAQGPSVWPCLPPPRNNIASAKPAPVKKRWGKDEVQLSLSLLSIKYYEKMNFSNRK